MVLGTIRQRADEFGEKRRAELDALGMRWAFPADRHQGDAEPFGARELSADGDPQAIRRTRADDGGLLLEVGLGETRQDAVCGTAQQGGHGRWRILPVGGGQLGDIAITRVALLKHEARAARPRPTVVESCWRGGVGSTSSFGSYASGRSRGVANVTHSGIFAVPGLSGTSSAVHRRRPRSCSA
ncbi:hypothetical protein ACIP93_25100 [Streptomyces sp. NPDC088745]|uniref:hypothetical protein n=1 Tax=Streptomyces sp. NPDC088745 TaxID=3365884 RepID=UPI003827BD92